MARTRQCPQPSVCGVRKHEAGSQADRECQERRSQATGGSGRSIRADPLVSGRPTLAPVPGAVEWACGEVLGQYEEGGVVLLDVGRGQKVVAVYTRSTDPDPRRDEEGRTLGDVVKFGDVQKMPGQIYRTERGTTWMEEDSGGRPVTLEDLRNAGSDDHTLSVAGRFASSLRENPELADLIPVREIPAPDIGLSPDAEKSRG